MAADHSAPRRRLQRMHLGRWLRWTLAALLTVLLVLDLALPPPLPAARDISALVVARDGTPLRAFADAGQRSSETIAAMGMGDAIVGHWRQLQDAGLGASQMAADVSEVTSAFSKAFRMFLQSAILTMAAWLVLRQEISSGMIVASSVISGRLLAPIDQVIGKWRQIARASTAHRRLGDFFDARIPLHAPLGLERPKGRIELRGLTRLAAREPGHEPRRLIDRLDLTLEPGTSLGVIGESAAGKSVLARILVGASDFDAGDLRFDGATRAQWGAARLGRHIGYLPQAVTMLPGSIRDNIRRFDMTQPAQEVIAAARLAGVHEMILGLAQGYDTLVGGIDQVLSGGQLQRIGLARAVFGQPAIVVLDEPNAHLDASGEQALRRAIQALHARGTTVILMTHRREILQEMDQVLVLREGALEKIGRAGDLLQDLGRNDGDRPGSVSVRSRPAFRIAAGQKSGSDQAVPAAIAAGKWQGDGATEAGPARRRLTAAAAKIADRGAELP
jgi:ATP-binding cassette subfamily C exporter for protease/lipase